jgi:3-isopropylmalate dehydrogenase
MGIANPIAEALQIETAVKKVIDAGLRTGDIFSGAPGTKKVNTQEIGDAIIAAL